jgi:RNA 3'-terminal phosphate cyclase (ATP)
MVFVRPPPTPEPPPRSRYGTMIDVDGSHGEGGGQIVRTAVAVAAATGKELHVTSIRARRQQPGLAAQHIAAVRCVGELCSARLEGLDIGSREITFRPGALVPGKFSVDVGTAGSIPLVLQAGLLAAAFAPGETELTVTGGTDVRAAPSMDYFAHVFLPLLARLGVVASVEVRKRGYYPRGGGEAVARISPGGKPGPLRIEGPGRIQDIHGKVHMVGLCADIMKRMAGAASAELKSFPATTRIDEETPPGIGPGTGITLWARTECSVLGASALGEQGLRAENVGAVAGRTLASEVKAGGSLDIHGADQILPYLALGSGGSFTVREVSSHLETGMWLLGLLTGARFIREKKYGLDRIECFPGR